MRHCSCSVTVYERAMCVNDMRECVSGYHCLGRWYAATIYEHDGLQTNEVVLGNRPGPNETSTPELAA